MSAARRKRDLAAAATRSSQRLNLGRDKHLLLLIGQCLKAQYDTLAASFRSRLAALVQQLETQEGIDRRARNRAVPCA
jgi:hypothetical protein